MKTEEKMQAQTFCELVLKYNYPVEQVRQFVNGLADVTEYALFNTP